MTVSEFVSIFEFTDCITVVVTTHLWIKLLFQRYLRLLLAICLSVLFPIYVFFFFSYFTVVVSRMDIWRIAVVFVLAAGCCCVSLVCINVAYPLYLIMNQKLSPVPLFLVENNLWFKISKITRRHANDYCYHFGHNFYINFRLFYFLVFPIVV
jgi:hypothetical protein